MSIPKMLLEYLENLSDRLASEGFSDSDTKEIAAHELISDRKQPMQLNEYARNLITYWFVGWDEPVPWPDDFYIIGENGAGNFYCVSRSGLFPGVKEYDHECKGFVPWVSSLEEYTEVVSIMAPRKNGRDALA